MSTPTLDPIEADESLVQVVGVGASAGGLKALEQLLRALPADPGMAVVVVQHLSPTRPALLRDILARCTAMPVKEVLNGMQVVANHVYTIAPNQDLLLQGNTLQLMPATLVAGNHLPIDTFFHSLAAGRRARAMGIVLSGRGRDGTRGCQAIVEAGGYTLAQLPGEADYDSMPVAVIASGFATDVAALDDMPGLLHHNLPISLRRSADSLETILAALHGATGHDFAHYKTSTISRRIERRMAVHHITDQAGYALYLQEHPAEIPLLFNELLINVTGFFRDPEAFVALKERVLRPMLAGKPKGYVFRAWVAGCASGEEAYSIAILLQELRREMAEGFEIQLYATDLDEDAIRMARSGFYPVSAIEQVSPARLNAWFTREDHGIRVRSELRKLVVFAVHNVVSDPPFTRLDLLSCRNLLIYLGVRLQKQVIPAFHYALKVKGALFLSPSESVGHYGALFTSLDRRWKLYETIKAARPSGSPESATRGWLPERLHKAPETPMKMTRSISVEDLTRRMLLQDFVPTSVATDLRGNIVYVHGDTGDYLRPAPGQATLNVIEMARDNLRGDLRAAIHTAASAQGAAPVQRRVRLSNEPSADELILSVRHLAARADEEPVLLITFEPVAPVSDLVSLPRGLASADPGQMAALELALAQTRENLQATIDELQISNEEFCSTNEELQSANEELESTNEELQSTNEELENSREALQSVNEELITVNAELQAKVEQLFDMQNDMKNLLDSINIGAIFLDTQLCIRRFNREAVNIFRLISKDVGRSLGDITSHLDGLDLMAPAWSVLDTLIPYQCEVRTQSDHWFLARIMPYRTLDNVIEGVVLTFHDITSRVITERSVEAARALAEAVVNTVREPLLVLDPTLKVVSASRSYLETFRTSAGRIEGRSLLELGRGEWNIDALRDRLANIAEQDASFSEFRLQQRFSDIGLLDITLDGRRVPGDSTRPHLILLAMQVHRRAEQGNEEANAATR